MNVPYDPFANVNLDAVPESDNNYDLIPNGEYGIRAVDMELKTSQNAGQHGNFGQMVAVQFEITGPTHAGRKIFANYNIVNDNATAVEIGLRELRSWMQACGKATSGQMSMERVYECVGMEFVGRVGVQKSKNPNYDDSNKIAKYKPHPMTAAAGQAPAAPAAPAPAPSLPPAEPVPDSMKAPAAVPAPAAPAAPLPGARPWER